jgi:hypothetical protein
MPGVARDVGQAGEEATWGGDFNLCQLRHGTLLLWGEHDGVDAVEVCIDWRRGLLHLAGWRRRRDLDDLLRVVFLFLVGLAGESLQRFKRGWLELDATPLISIVILTMTHIWCGRCGHPLHLLGRQAAIERWRSRRGWHVKGALLLQEIKDGW